MQMTEVIQAEEATEYRKLSHDEGGISVDYKADVYLHAHPFPAVDYREGEPARLTEWGDYQWVSERFRSCHDENGFDYWFVCELIDWEDHRELPDDEFASRYTMVVSVASPQEAGRSAIESAYGTCGMDVPEKTDDEYTAVVLSDVGTAAHVASLDGNDADALVRQAAEQIPAIAGLLGFFLDRPMNLLGDTGRYFMRGCRATEETEETEEND